ncbi:MAG: transcriptional regulator [Methylobacterium sp.]|nr:MAG: transcriptional regulator [Methylobacterium sp.]
MDSLSENRNPATTEGEVLELEGFLPYRLNVLATLVSQSLARVYGERFGISIPEWRILATLGQFPEMTAREIGQHSRMHKTTVSRAVSALEKRELVARRPNRQDMREAFLAMTPQGQAIYAEIVPLARSFAQDLTRNIRPEDLAVLDRVLSQLMGCLKNASIDPSDEL